jgi:hypothetical protein
MTTKKIIALGCGSIFLIALLIVAAVGAFIVHASKDVEGVAVSAESTADVVVGQTFELAVTVTNERPRKPMMLSDVDVAEDYLAGFTVVAMDPKPKSSQHVPIDNSRSFHFGLQIPPHTARNFKFKLRAEKAGTFRGDVDACEGTRFITCLAETVVKEKEKQ